MWKQYSVDWPDGSDDGGKGDDMNDDNKVVLFCLTQKIKNFFLMFDCKM